jgi:RNA polymerase sigma-70 factor (ECF subfamily)
VGAPTVRSRFRLRSRSDEQLVAAVIGGDRRAFDELMRRHKGLFISACARAGGRQEDLEDLVQDATLAVLKALPTFHGESELTTWMWPIAFRVAIASNSQLRKEGHVSLEERSMKGHEMPDEGALWNDQLAAREVVRQAVASLPERQREGFLLAIGTGMKYAKIGELLFANENTVKAWVRRSRAEIRRQLEIES